MLNEGTTIVMDRYAYSGVAYSAAKVKKLLYHTDTYALTRECRLIGARAPITVCPNPI